MSHSVFKAPLQPSQHGSPLYSHSSNQTYHLPHSFSPKSKEDPSKPDRGKPVAQTRIKKLSFLLNPNTENLLRSDDDPAPQINSMVSFHTPSRSSGGELSKKFIQLKGSASSSQLSFDFFNSKDLVRLAMNKAKAKETVKKERVRTPNNMSTVFKKPQSMHINSSVLDSHKEDGVHRFNSPSDNDGIGYRGSRPTTGDKAAKVRRLHQIYNEGSPGDRLRQTQSNLHALSQDMGHNIFHHSLSPTSGSISKLLTPGQTPISMKGDYKFQTNSQRQSNRQKPNQEQSKRNKAREEEMCPIKTPNTETSTERQAQLKKVSSNHILKPNATGISKFSFPATPPLNDTKDRGRSPNSRVRRIKLPFENLEVGDTYGRKFQESRSRKDSFADLELAVQNLVRTCEQSLEPAPRSRGVSEKVKQAQENVLDRLRGLSRNNEESKIAENNLDAVVREKKCIEGELSVVKEENERLRRRMKEMCQRFKANKLKGNNNDISLMEDSSGRLGENFDTERTSNLKKVIGQQQMIIQDMKKKENVVKKVLDMIRKTGVDLDAFSSNNNIEEESFQGISTSDPKREKLTESQKLEEEAYQWELDTRENREITERDEDQKDASSYIKVEDGDDDDTEKWKVEDDDKMMSGIRESEDESVRQRIVKHTYSDAKSTADSAGLSTRKLTKGRRSLSIKMKSKLKLDLTRVTGSLSVPKYNIISGQSSNEKFMLNFPAAAESGQGQGFHEEFMSRFEEFSQSWRQAALHQKL